LTERLPDLARLLLLQPDEQCEKVGEFYNWDVPSALFMEDFEKALETTCQEARQVAGASLVLVDGILLFSSPSLPDKYDAIIELHLEESCHRERRFQRDKWIQKNADYWDQIVMPAHAVHGRVPRPIHCHHAAIDASNTREEVLQSALRHIDAWRHHKQSRPSEQD
jgi:uridine kinase